MGKASLGISDKNEHSPTDAKEFLVIDSDEHNLIEVIAEAPYQTSRQDREKRKCWIGWLVGLVGVLLLAAVVLISLKFYLNQKYVSGTQLSQHSELADQVGLSTTDEPTTAAETAGRVSDLMKDTESGIHVNKDSHNSNESARDDDMSQYSEETQPSSDIQQTDPRSPDLMLGIFKDMVNGINKGESNSGLGLGDLDNYGTTSSPNYYKYAYYNYNYGYKEDDDEIWPDDSEKTDDGYQHGTTPGSGSWPGSYDGGYYDYAYDDKDKGKDDTWYMTTEVATSWSPYYGKNYYYDDSWYDDYSSEQANEDYGDAEYVTTSLPTAWPQYVEYGSYDYDSIWPSDSSEEQDTGNYDDLWVMTTPEATQDWYDYEEDIGGAGYDYVGMGHFANSIAKPFNKVMDKAGSESWPALDDNESDETGSVEQSQTTDWLYGDLTTIPGSQAARLDSDQEDGDVYDDESVTGSAEEEADYYADDEYYSYWK